MPCFVPRLEVTGVFRLQPYNVTETPTHHTPNLYKIQIQNHVSLQRKEEEEKKRQVQSKETCPYRYICITLHNTFKHKPYSSFLRRGKLEIPGIRTIETLYL